MSPYVLTVTLHRQLDITKRFLFPNLDAASDHN